jgi:hypothetical protein
MDTDYQTTGQPPQRPRRRPRSRIVRIAGGAFVLLVLILVIVGVVSGSNKPTPSGGQPNVNHTTSASTQTSPASAPTTPSTLGFGSAFFRYSDGTQVSVSSATPATLSQEAAGGNAGDPAVNVTIRVTAGKASIDATEISVSANGGPDGTQLNQSFDVNTSNPSGTLAPGETGSYTFLFDLQKTTNGNPLNITVTPGFDYQNASFTGKVS